MTRRFLLPLLLLLILFSIGGVYAVWVYAELPAAPAEQTIACSILAFEYPPETILPGGEIEESELGENHYYLIDLILNESNKGYGLNYSDNVALHKYLNDDGVVYSNQKISGGNLKFILDPKNDTQGLYYCLEKVSDTEYYAYTFSTNELLNVGGLDMEMVVYRTTLLKTDEWEATTSYMGYAKAKSLNNLGASADPNTIPYSVDMSTWHM